EEELQMEWGGRYLNTINATATLLENGIVVVWGPIGCPKGMSIELRAMVTQESSGAAGVGYFQSQCAGAQKRWVAAVEPQEVAFEPGELHVTAWAMTDLESGQVTRSWSWAKSVELQRAG